MYSLNSIVKFSTFFQYRTLIFMPVLLLLISSCNSKQLPAQDITVNNIGYIPDAPKLAFVEQSLQPADSFAVIDVRSSEVIYKNKIDSNFEKDPATGEAVQTLNFTELENPGTYKVKIHGTDLHSPKFEIYDDVYNNILKTTVESFYYQRCGTEIGSGTKWKHAACHLEDAPFYDDTDRSKDVKGGWHDAGDFGKFSVNTAVSLSFLLYLYDYKKGALSDWQLDIPGNNNGIPDLLDEAKWALTWLMKMQRSDGAVFHKVQKKKWSGEYLPQKDPDTRYIYEVSSTATADVAAVVALGARLFQSADSEFSDSLKHTAEKAWGYLEDHPQMIPKGGFKNPKGVKGGEYSDHKDSDERLWAAVEMYRLTENEKYHQYFLDHYSTLGGPQSPPVSWKNVGELAYYSYLEVPVRQQDSRARKFISKKLMAYADKLVKRTSQSGYRIALSKDEFYWGSNSVMLGYAFDLVHAYELTGLKLYREAALDQLHYILGRNPFGLSFVTGVGEQSVKNPYHQFSIKLNTELPVPGMVVGGPNSKNQLHDEPLSNYPAKNYEDNQENYMVNETAINYTAPLVYLSGYFSDLNTESNCE